MLRAPAHGFTLIELGVVLIMLGLILGIAAPAVRHSTTSSRLGAAADGVVVQLHLARELAVDSRASVTLRFAEALAGLGPPDLLRRAARGSLEPAHRRRLVARERARRGAHQ